MDTHRSKEKMIALVRDFSKAAYHEMWGGCIQLYTYCNIPIFDEDKLKYKKIPVRVASFYVTQAEQMLPLFYEFLYVEKKNRKKWLRKHPLFSRCINYYLINHDKDFPLELRREYFITANGLDPRSKHREDDLRCMGNIVIDIDRHDKDSDADFIKRDSESIVGHIKAQLEGYGVWPSAVNYTGRGVHIWFSFESAAAEMKDVFKKTYRSLKEMINKVINEHPECGFDTIDGNASSKPAGLFRLPGSFNEKAKNGYIYGVFGECEVDERIHDRPRMNINTFRNLIEYTTVARLDEPTDEQIRCLNDIEYNLDTKFEYTTKKEAADLIEKYLPESINVVRSQGDWILPPTERQMKAIGKYAPGLSPATKREAYEILADLIPKAEKARYKDSKKGDYAPLLRFRLELIEYDVKYKNNPAGSEKRHDHLHMFYNAALQLWDKEKAQEETARFNREAFKEPADLSVNFAQFENHEIYKYRQEDFFVFLAIDKEELQSFLKNRNNSRYRVGSNGLRDERRLNKRIHKYLTAFDLYEDGLLVSEIVKIIKKTYGSFCSKSFRKYLAGYRAFMSEYNDEYLPRLNGTELCASKELTRQFKKNIRKYHQAKTIRTEKYQQIIRVDAVSCIVKNNGFWDRSLLSYLPGKALYFKTSFGKSNKVSVPVVSALIRTTPVKGMHNNRYIRPLCEPWYPSSKLKEYTANTNKKGRLGRSKNSHPIATKNSLDKNRMRNGYTLIRNLTGMMVCCHQNGLPPPRITSPP